MLKQYTKVFASAVNLTTNNKMQSFKSYLEEHILSIGINDKDEPKREKHRQEIHDMLRKGYSHPDVGGYGGIKSGSKEESDAIHHDITHSMIKATVRNGKVSAVNLYKNSHGRKSIAVAHDGTEQGREDFKRTRIEDHKNKRSWGEVSGAVEHIAKKIGSPVIPVDKASKLVKKTMTPDGDEGHYIRKIGGHDHRKIAMGHYKD